MAGTYQLPFGKGRQYLSKAPRFLHMLAGGLQDVGAWYFNSGAYLRFEPALTAGDPSIDNPAPDRWVDTSVFSVLPLFTPRKNPDHYRSVRGPMYSEMQGSLSKQFQITPERVRFELCDTAYDLTNRLSRADPDVTITRSSYRSALRRSAKPRDGILKKRKDTFLTLFHN